ncbi:DUF4116 domain-containing protein [Candidatus Nomurabacteria bacterium]|nr:DUF4116 domain-containing protein [Candidatus Nomurabacteria bacterium]
MNTENNINYEYTEKETALEAVENDRYVLASLPPNLQDDAEIVRAAISLETLCGSNMNGPVFKYASPRLRSKRNIVLEAVKNYGEAIEYASPSFDDDKEIVLTALNNSWVDTYPYGGSVIYDCIPFKLFKDKQVKEGMGYTKEKTDIATSLVKLSMDLFPDKYERAERKKREEEYNTNYLKRRKERLDRWENEKKEWEDKMTEWRQKQKDKQYKKYSDWRKQTEQMPIYERWKRDVIQKCGNKCQLDKSHAGRYAEVHHIDSLYSIYIKNNLTSDEEIIKCKELWNIDNGIVLCKECHDKMESSQNRQAIISKNNK